MGVAVPLVSWFVWQQVLPQSWKKKLQQTAAVSKPEADRSLASKTNRVPVPQVQPRVLLTNAEPPVLSRNSASTNSTASAPATNPPANSARKTLPSYLPATGNDYPRKPNCVFEVQLALARARFSPGTIDAVLGGQTRAALRAFQRNRSLPETGEPDDATLQALQLESAPLDNTVISADIFAKLQPLSKTWLGKSQQSALDYETVLECFAERAQSSLALLRILNPGFDWAQAAAGAVVKLPAIAREPVTAKAALLHIRLRDRILQAEGSDGEILAHFPCSIAQRVDKRPIGELHVQVIVPGPNYTFDPKVFPESEEGRQLGRKLVLPPGPNNPVGVAWIGLDRPGYGIHGTPNPEQVGRTESHGCFRLANWNAEHLISLAWIGMPVIVEP